MSDEKIFVVRLLDEQAVFLTYNLFGDDHGCLVPVVYIKPAVYFYNNDS